MVSHFLVVEFGSLLGQYSLIFYHALLYFVQHAKVYVIIRYIKLRFGEIKVALFVDRWCLLKIAY